MHNLQNISDYFVVLIVSNLVKMNCICGYHLIFLEIYENIL